MTLLGTLALWLALLVGVWGALAGFVGGRNGRADLAHSARHAVFAMCGALLVAVVSLEWALFQHEDRKSTRLNSSHRTISYAVFCLKKKKIMSSHDGSENTSTHSH